MVLQLIDDIIHLEKNEKETFMVTKKFCAEFNQSVYNKIDYDVEESQMKINSAEYKQFMVFDNLTLKFSPNINIITGLNGVGKTIVLKTLYSFLKTIENINKEMTNPLGGKLSEQKINEMLSDKIIGVFMPEFQGFLKHPLLDILKKIGLA